MDENRVSGTAREMGGKLEEGFGRATGDFRTESEGKLKRAQGAVQDAYGHARDAAEELREHTYSFEDTLRSTIETRPYTTLVVAFCLGWALGRTWH
jgi:uncharacterized protein YjbJ (UPF0337 family)